MLDNLKKVSLSQLMFHLNKKVYWIFHKRSFAFFGKNSVIQKPILPITNKKCIYIGSNVLIRPHIRIEAIKKFLEKDYKPKITINDGTTIEQCCHITCANEVFIGKNVTIAAFSMITDIDHEYQDIKKGILQQGLIVKKTIIGDETFIGMGSRIMPGVTIGKHCIIGTNSIVISDIPEYCVAVGAPAKVVKKYDFDKEQWISIKRQVRNDA